MRHVGLTRIQAHMWKHIVDCVREIPCFANVTVDVNPWFTWEPVDVGTDIKIEVEGFEWDMSAAGDDIWCRIYETGVKSWGGMIMQYKVKPSGWMGERDNNSQHECLYMNLGDNPVYSKLLPELFNIASGSMIFRRKQQVHRVEGPARIDLFADQYAIHGVNLDRRYNHVAEIACDRDTGANVLVDMVNLEYDFGAHEETPRQLIAAFAAHNPNCPDVVKAEWALTLEHLFTRKQLQT